MEKYITPEIKVESFKSESILDVSGTISGYTYSDPNMTRGRNEIDVLLP